MEILFNTPLKLRSALSPIGTEGDRTGLFSSARLNLGSTVLLISLAVAAASYEGQRFFPLSSDLMERLLQLAR